jgi:ribose 5-phosphate isomerase A
VPVSPTGYHGLAPAQAMDREEQKRAAGEAAADLVRDGMVLGLGTGSTVRYAIEAIGRRAASGLRVSGVPTSRASEELARRVGIPIVTLEENPELDLTIDGADEFDPRLRLIKGGGGALTREKVVARSSRRMVVVADGSKRVQELGTTFPLPVEVVEFARSPLLRLLRDLGAEARTRTDPSGRPVLTDNGNPIVDAKFSRIDDPETLELRLETFPGVVATGLFLGLCQAAYVAGPGGLEVVHPQ